MSELAPGLIKCRLEPGNELVWVNPSEVEQGELRQPPFDVAHREIFRKIKDALDEVHPLTLEQWELGFRRDTNPRVEIRKWRWLAYMYSKLTRPARRTTGVCKTLVFPQHGVGKTRVFLDQGLFASNMSLSLKRDIFRLLLVWTYTGDVEEVLATTLPFAELSEQTARQILDACQFIPAEFFGGNLIQMLGIVGLSAELSVIDYITLKSVDDFNTKTELADIIVAVDWPTGDTEVVYGVDTIRTLALADPNSKPKTLGFVCFAIDFDGEELNHLLASVLESRGHYYYNGERHTSDEE
jgi:hypothetical protein